MVDNPLIATMKGDQIDGQGIVQSEVGDLKDDKVYNDSAWIKDHKVECEDSKENSMFAAKEIDGIGEGIINQILQERLGLLEGLLENVRKEMEARRYAQ